jgi:hypothetical protein
MNESILSVLQSDGDQGRVVLVHRFAFGKSELLLRRESFSEDIGWFEQSAIELSSGQVGQLKQALAVLPSPKSRPLRPATTTRSISGETVADRPNRFSLVS